jgi:hypothetical protein
MYKPTAIRDLKVGDRFRDGSATSIVTEEWSDQDRTFGYRHEDTETPRIWRATGGIRVDVELKPGTPDYYRAHLAAMTDAEALRQFEAVVTQFAGMPIGHDLWTTTSTMVAIARTELAARLAR